MIAHKSTQGLGLALGSGGARGFAHIAVIEEMYHHGLYPEVITGASMGAVVGAVMALYNDIEVVKSMARHFLQQKKRAIEALIQSIEGKGGFVGQLDLARRMTLLRSVEDDRFLYGTLSLIFGKARFEDAKIPLGVVTCDYHAASTELVNSGYMVDAIAASATVPGIFPPRVMGGSIMVDGGVSRVVPVLEAKRMGASQVVGVDVSEYIRRRDYNNTFDLVNYLDKLKGEKIAQKNLQDADLNITFKEVEHEWYRFDLFEDILKDARLYLQTDYREKWDLLAR